MKQLSPRRAYLRVVGLFFLATVVTMAWLRGDNVRDERGSDSTEKALMIVLGVGLAAAVAAFAVPYVNRKLGAVR